MKRNLHKEELNEDSDENDNEDLLHKSEMNKLVSLWKSMKESKKRSDFSSPNMTKQMKKREERSTDNREVDIEEKVSLMHQNYSRTSAGNPDQVIKFKEQNMNLTKKLLEAEEEINRCHEKIAKHVHLNNVQHEQISEISMRLEYLNKDKEKSMILDEEVSRKEREIVKLRSLTEEMDSRIRFLTETLNSRNEKLEKMELELENKLSENARLKKKLDEAEKAIDELYLQRNNESLALLELDYLRNDVARLLKLLRSTEEFKDISTTADDSNNIRFLHNYQKSQKAKENSLTGKAPAPRSKKRICSCMHSPEPRGEEKVFWVPLNAFQFASEFKEKNNGELNQNSIEELLGELNKIWTQREQKAVARIKNQYESEIKDLKRQLNSVCSFEDINSRKKISRLQGELRKVRKENRDTVAEIKKNNLNPTQYVSDTLRLTVDFENERKKCEGEIVRLKAKVNNLEQAKEEGLYDKIIYMEGALWMVNKLIKETLQFKENVCNLENEYAHKWQELPLFNQHYVLATDVERFNEWLIGSFLHLTEGFDERCSLMRESVKNKLGDHFKTLPKE